MGFSPGSHKEHKRKHEEPSKKSGSKSNKQRIPEASIKLVKSVQYPTIMVDLRRIVTNEDNYLEYERDK